MDIIQLMVICGFLLYLNVEDTLVIVIDSLVVLTSMRLRKKNTVMGFRPYYRNDLNFYMLVSNKESILDA